MRPLDLLLPFFLIHLSLALPAKPLPLIPRACATTCGSNCYTSSQINEALSAGYNYYESGDKAGSSKYPEKYNDYEGFDFGGVSGPYYEFPILESGVYSGGSPGADRIVFNTDGDLAGEITHTGASDNDFVGCTGTS
ncbi:ribonuclease-domain-containing protein [Mytilinidion resinicola]|uniref:ribonuclease T1 n=1 Tax=Mytilinidion resinicola TaxID=574789 RepID=A0A6A6YF61_9PEZI|nr:ribonuclease-domain-containing protein [Mytilinidion resinicola]KAF2806497.1 ribonuclease-domain-containing protein [Mytilinidion resinicola]